ncbi:hypothetical protein NB526_04465 [Vibrio alginolyticus]|uniref:hypothetical protein n=1 Tax=Vibrio alginolyticus TaxID=663 RepID=UPI00215D34E0|nr:hypothetical protein [Vibrio alginolyticus]MCR9389655.1 hypothetical protein [Vibrio alginolyticus]
MNLALIGFIFCSFILARVNRVRYFAIQLWLVILFLLLISYYSLFLGNDPELISRFLVILFIMCVSYHIKPDKNYIYIAAFCFFIQAMVVIVLQFLLNFYFSADYASTIRNLYILKGWGDVYNYGYGLWNVQLKGNALLPFFCFISFLIFQGWRRIIITSVFAISCLFSGNFAFVLGFFSFFSLYALIKVGRSMNKLRTFIVLCIVTILLSSSFVYKYITKVIEQKSGYSGQHRLEQTLALIGDMGDNYISAFFGKGLGNVNISGFGFEFHNTIYFELQTLYILNQLGVLFFIAFLFFNVFFTVKYIRYPVLIAVYMSYVVYSFWNPYIFDTNHIVVIVVLVSLSHLMKNEKLGEVSVRHCYHPLQP